MNHAFTCSLYITAFILLGISFMKDKRKTAASLKRAFFIFMGVLPQFIVILFITGLMLALVKPETIQRIIGRESGFFGMLAASLLGALTLVPVIIAFPVAAELLNNGAGLMQVTIFISTLTMVGLITLPLEMKYLGKKTALLRNSLAYLGAFVTAFVIGTVIK